MCFYPEAVIIILQCTLSWGISAFNTKPPNATKTKYKNSEQFTHKMKNIKIQINYVHAKFQRYKVLEAEHRTKIDWTDVLDYKLTLNNNLDDKIECGCVCGGIVVLLSENSYN